jgi:hypothetical protein
MGNPRYQEDGPDGEGFGLTLHWDKLEEPYHWRRPRRIFVNSMSDLFHPAVPEEFLARSFAVMLRCRQGDPDEQASVALDEPRLVGCPHGQDKRLTREGCLFGSGNKCSVLNRLDRGLSDIPVNLTETHR